MAFLHLFPDRIWVFFTARNFNFKASLFHFPSDGLVDEVAGAEGENAATNSSGSAPLSPTKSPEDSAKARVEAVLESPAAGAVFNSDSKSRVFALDQNYTARGDNGLTARFTFNPSSEEVFTDLLVEVEIDSYFFEFEPVNRQLITGKNSENLDVYILVGDATYLYDEFGKKWSESELGKAKIKIEVVMEVNGTTVKSINLALYSR